MSKQTSVGSLQKSLGSVKIESLVELVAFLRHRSTQAVSQELGVSQSALSKHLSKLEADLGFPLFEHGYKLTFTPAGRRFATYAAAFLETLVRGAQECAELGTGGVRALRMESNDMYFAGQENFNRVLNGFMTLHDDYDYVVSPKHARNAKAAIRQDLVDFSLWYDFGQVDQIVAEAEKEGWGLIHLSSEHMMVWANKNHRIFSLDTITAAAVARERIMTASPAGYSGTSSIAGHLFQTAPFQRYAIKQDIRLVDTRAKLLMSDPAGSIFLLPESFGNVPQVYERTSMRFRVVEDGSTLHHMFLIYDLNTQNQCVREFADYLRAEL